MTMEEKMKNILKTLAQISLGVLLVVGLLNIGPHKTYDFKKTLVHISGIGGSGSGNIIKTNSKSSVILTNKHVCEGVKVPNAISQALDFFTVLMDKIPGCNSLTCYAEKNPFVALMLIQVLGELSEVPEVGTIDPEKLDALVIKLLELKKAYLLKPLTVKFNNLKLGNALATTIKVSPDKDLCLIEVPIGNLPTAKIATKLPKVGDKVQTIGNPLEVTNHMVEGFVGDNSKIYGNFYTLITAPIFPGQSGSGTFNMDGRLVGVNTLSWVEVATIGYMIPLNDILEFIN